MTAPVATGSPMPCWTSTPGTGTLQASAGEKAASHTRRTWTGRGYIRARRSTSRGRVTSMCAQSTSTRARLGGADGGHSVRSRGAMAPSPSPGASERQSGQQRGVCDRGGEAAPLETSCTYAICLAQAPIIVPPRRDMRAYDSRHHRPARRPCIQSPRRPPRTTYRPLGLTFGNPLTSGWNWDSPAPSPEPQHR